MTTNQQSASRTHSREMRVGKTLYRVTSIYSGEKDLKSTLEQLAVSRTLAELTGSARASAKG